MPAKANTTLKIWLSEQDSLMKTWFRLAGEQNVNKSGVIMLTLKYYMLHKKYITVAYIHKDMLSVTEENAYKKVNVADTYADVFEWLKTQTDKPSKLIKAIFKNCIKVSEEKTSLMQEDELQLILMGTKEEELVEAQPRFSTTTTAPDTIVSEVPKAEKEVVPTNHKETENRQKEEVTELYNTNSIEDSISKALFSGMTMQLRL